MAVCLLLSFSFLCKLLVLYCVYLWQRWKGGSLKDVFSGLFYDGVIVSGCIPSNDGVNVWLEFGRKKS
jgi:hypothetical protein